MEYNMIRRKIYNVLLVFFYIFVIGFIIWYFINTQKNKNRFVIDNKEVKIALGNDYKVGLKIDNKEYLSNNNYEDVKWESSNDNVALVDQNGVVTGLNKGTAEITARSNNGSIAVMYVEIYGEETETKTTISLNKDNIELDIGDSFELVPTIENASNTDIKWISSDDTVATVSNGIVTAKKSGNAKIVAKLSDGSNASCAVKVKKELEDLSSITFDNKNITAKVGDTLKLTPIVSSPNNEINTLTWFSSDDNIAKVDKEGNVDFIKSGSVTITVLANNGKSASVTITVNDDVVNAKDITLDKTNIDLNVGDTFTLNYFLEPENAAKIVIWASNNKAVASVNNGVVTAKSEGQAIISAVLKNGKTATCVVNVKNGVKSSFTIDKVNLSLKIDKEEKINAINGTNVRWESSDSNIATVDQNGTVKGINEGKATIKAINSDGQVSVCYVTVSENNVYPNIIKLDVESKSINVGEQVTLTYKLFPVNAVNNGVTWSSSNPNVATVNNGIVYAKSEGTAIIKVITANGVQDTCTIKVGNKANYDVEAKSISIDKEVVNIDSDTTTKLSVTFEPKNTTNKKIKWTSSDENVATIDNDGNLKAKKMGKTIIIAESSNGLKAQATVNVFSSSKGNIQANSINLSQEKVSMNIGDGITLTAVISPSNTTNKEITWSSSNPNVVSVNNGYIKALKNGTALITATTSNGKTDTCAVSVENNKVSITNITLNKTSINLNLGETFALKANIKPENATNKNITWSSNNNDVVSVDASGNIKALKNGTATITATTSNGLNATCVVKVVAQTVDVKDVSLNYTNVNMGIGDSLTLVASINPSNATSKGVTWTTSDASLASVDAYGNVKALKAGSVVIKATTNNGKQASCTIVISNNIVNVDSVTLNKTSLNMNAGDTVELSATIAPSNATNKNVTWTSSDASIASVDTSGNVKAKKAGTVVISATSANGKQATCAITVQNVNVAVTGISLNQTNYNMNINDSVTLKAIISPSNATNKNVTWSSSNTKIAIVDASGKISAKSTGTVTITATTNNGKQATCKITITNKQIDVKSISLNKTKESLSVNNTITLKATIEPSNASSKSVTWTSNNSSIATVDKNGNVKAIKKGTATITATTNNGKTATCIINVNENNVEVKSISIRNTDISLNVGKNDTILVNIEPSNATNKNITYSSSDSSIVSVDSKGNIKAKKAGLATITATSANGKTAQATVNVLSDKIFAIDSTNSTSVIIGNYNVKDYGAKGDGVTDDTQAFKNAIADANNCLNQTSCLGYTVYVPKGTYLIKDSLDLGPAVGLVGELKEGTTDGTVLMIDFGAGTDDINKAAIKMNSQSYVANMAFWYPNQSATANGYTTVYPATILQTGSYGLNLENINFVNSFVAVDLASHHFDLSLQIITNIYGSPFRGIISDGNFDTIRITNLNFNANYWINSGLSNVPSASNIQQALKNRGEGLIFERIDWYFLAGIRVDNYNVGIHLRDSIHQTKNSTQTVYTPDGEMYDVQLTNCNYAIYVQNSRPFSVTVATLTSTNPNIGALHIDNSDVISINSATISGSKSIVNGGPSSISTTNSVIKGTIQRSGSNPKMSFANTSLTNTGFEGSSFNDSIVKGPDQLDYNKRVVTKPKSNKIITINAEKGTDITSKLKEAINSLKSTGGIVYIPAGNYVVSDHIDVYSGIEIRGTTPWFHNWTQFNTNSGTWNEYSTRIATAYKGDVLFTLYSNAGINGLSIMYDNQNMSEFPYTIRGNGSNIYIMNIAIPNGWQGVDLATYRCDNHYVDGVHGQFYKMGIKVGAGSQNGIVKNCHIHINAFYYLFALNGKDNATYYNNWKYLVNNETAFEVGESTNELLFHNFVYNAKIGFNVTNGANNFTLLSCGADAAAWVSHHVSGHVTGQIVNNIMEPMAGNDKYCYRYNGSACYLAGNNVADRRYLKFGDSYSGFVKVINPIGWGNGSDSTAFEYAGDGDAHIVGGIVFDTASPAIKIRGRAISIYGLIINRSPNPVYEIASTVKGIALIGNICNHGVCTNYMTNNSGLNLGSDDRGTK